MASGIVGFSPATTTLVSTTGSAAPQAEGGAPNLFAMLLSLVGAQPASTQAQTTAQAAAGATSTAPAAAGGVAGEVAATGTSAILDLDLDLANAGANKSGKSLLKDLGDALLALSDAVAAGEPVDPALDDKLNEAIDAVAAYFGISPQQPAIDPRITALSGGTDLLPAPATDLPAPAPAGESQPAGDAEPAAPASAATIAPASASPDAQLPPDFAALIANLGVSDPPPFTGEGDQPQDAGGGEATSPASSATPTATSPAKPDETPPALQALGLVIGKLGERLAPSDSGLATKLDTLAEALKSGTVPDDLAALLGSGESAAEPEIERITQALTAPRPAPAASPATQPFATPQLALPTQATAADPPEGRQPQAVGEVDTAGETADVPDLRQPVKLAGESPDLDVSSSEVQPAATQVSSTASATPPAPAAAATVPAAPALDAAAAPVARAAHAAYQAPVQQVNLPQVAFELARQVEAGTSRFEIRLDPPEMGRIDVELDIDASGTVNARMTVERPETLDLMQRDQRALQQALQQAGLDTGKTNLEFSLRQNPFAQQGGMGGDGRGGQPAHGNQPGAYLTEDGPQEAATLYRGTVTTGGVNLFV